MLRKCAGHPNFPRTRHNRPRLTVSKAFVRSMKAIKRSRLSFNALAVLMKEWSRCESRLPPYLKISTGMPSRLGALLFFKLFAAADISSREGKVSSSDTVWSWGSWSTMDWSTGLAWFRSSSRCYAQRERMSFLSLITVVPGPIFYTYRVRVLGFQAVNPSAGSRKYFFCSAKRKSATKIEFVCSASASVKHFLRNSPHPQFQVNTFGCLVVD